MRKLTLFAIVLLLSNAVQAQQDNKVRAQDAINFVGEFAMVCGVIASATYMQKSRGKPTYLP